METNAATGTSGSSAEFWAIIGVGVMMAAIGITVIALGRKWRENMADQVREERFNQSIRDWGYVFMLTIWLQSIMISAIAKKMTSSRQDELTKRNELMKKDMARTWREFKDSFPGNVTTDEELVADMVILIRNQLAHCHISSGRGFALFLPSQTSQILLEKLKNAGWIEAPTAGASVSEMIILREGDTEWFARNAEMIRNFSENTILRLTRAYGVDDSAIC